MNLLSPILSLLALATVASAQSGLIIYKDAPWDQDQFAKGILYKKVGKFPTVHNVEPMKGEPVRIKSALVLKDITFPTADSVRDMEDEAQIKQLEGLAADWSATLKRFPQVAKFLKPKLSDLQNDITQFHAGKVKSEGVWMTRDALAAKQKRIAEERARVAAKIEEESKRRAALVAEWEQLDEAERKRMRDAKAEAQSASYQANQEKRLDEEIKRLEAIAAKRALMKPAERLSTDTWVTPPGLKEEESKQYEDAIKAAKEQFAKTKEAFGFGLECQRFVLAAGKRVYAFKPVDVAPEATLVPGDEKGGSSASIVLSCPGEKRGIDSFALDGSEATSVTSVTIPIAKEVDGKKLAESLTQVLTLTGKKEESAPPTTAATPQP